jgi:glutathione-regulated potassium-efflux system ancillary protein KefG
MRTCRARCQNHPPLPHTPLRGVLGPFLECSDQKVDSIEESRTPGWNLGLGQPNSVSTYQHRYADMPRPVVDLGEGRCKLWLRPQIEAWARRRQQHSGARKQGHGDEQ